MTCRAFLRDLPDWVAGRLVPETDRHMRQHCDGCPRCAQADADERRLRAWLDLLAPAPETADLWPRLAGRLEPPRAAPWWRSGQRGLAMATALAAACLLAAMVLMRMPSGHGPGPAPAPLVDERAVAVRIVESRALPDPDDDPIWSQMRQTHQDARLALLGEAGQ